MNPDKIRTFLNILFLILAVVSVALYFMADDFKTFIYVCSAAIFCKVLEKIIKFTI